MPPLSPNEMNEIVRRVAEQMRPVTRRLDAHSGEMKAVRAEIREEISPAVMRKISDAQAEFDERSAGFEQFLSRVVGRIDDKVGQLEEKVDIVVRSIPPAATAAKGAEAAAVAGAQAMVRTEGKTDAVQVAADRADKNSLATRVKANQLLIVTILGLVFQAIWQAYQAVAHAVTP